MQNNLPKIGKLLLPAIVRVNPDATAGSVMALLKKAAGAGTILPIATGIVTVMAGDHSTRKYK